VASRWRKLFLKRGKERKDRSGKNTKLIVKLMWFQRGQISGCQVIIGLLWNRSLRRNDQAATRTKLSSSFSIPVMRSDEGGRGGFVLMFQRRRKRNLRVSMELLRRTGFSGG
jgi:hypothetical protein